MKHLLDLGNQRSTFSALCSTSDRRYISSGSGLAAPHFSSVDSRGQECPRYTLQYWSECGYHFSGLHRGIDAEPALYLVAKILAVAHHVGGISRGPIDWSDAAFFCVV